MNFEQFWGHIRFDNFASVASWLCSAVPFYFVDVFVLSCLFAILKIIIHLGGRK